jgi:hypothetical protein
MRFYFDIRDDFYVATDREGLNLPTVDAARREGSDIAASIARDLFQSNGSRVVVTVRNDTRPLFELTLTLTQEDLEPDKSKEA